LERARAERRDAELKLIHDLERQAGAWFRAKFLHRYVRAAQRALGNEQMTAQRGGETVDFLVWAQGYVDQLNPLHPAAHNDDLLSERSIWHGDQDIQKGMARLVGFEGQKACKLFRLVEDGDVDQDDDSDDW
jgi:2,3-bisphosphoglycerate-independent phosphoglycerate mutase